MSRYLISPSKISFLCINLCIESLICDLPVVDFAISGI